MYFDIYYSNSLGQILNLVQEPYRMQTSDIMTMSGIHIRKVGILQNLRKRS